MISPISRPGAVQAAAAVAVLAGFTLAGCGRHAAPVASPRIVVAARVHSESGAGAGEFIRYPVEVAARYSNAMAFRVAGKLIERDARLGDTVRQGQVIARLDPTDARKEAASAQAALDAAKHRLAYARQQLDRDVAQSAQNLIAANQLEQTQDGYAAALAARDQAAAQRVIAFNTLRYNSLTAERDGIITSENADTGQVVAAGQAIYGLAWTGDTDVNLDAAASDLGRITIGQSARVTFAALPGLTFDARVREIAPAADPQSRTYRVKLTLPKPGAAVRFGMTGDAILSPPATAAGGVPPAAPTFEVPATAIFHQGRDPAVWVIRAEDSTLELRPVSVRSYGERAAILTGGLKDGDTIVLAGVHTVFAGEHVQPVKPLFADEAEGGAGRSGAAGLASAR